MLGLFPAFWYCGHDLHASLTSLVSMAQWKCWSKWYLVCSNPGALPLARYEPLGWQCSFLLEVTVEHCSVTGWYCVCTRLHPGRHSWASPTCFLSSWLQSRVLLLFSDELVYIHVYMWWVYNIYVWWVGIHDCFLFKVVTCICLLGVCSSVSFLPLQRLRHLDLVFGWNYHVSIKSNKLVPGNDS